jgi:predicted nucleic acid-binding protein
MPTWRVQIEDFDSEPIPLIDSLTAAAALSTNSTLVHRDAHMAGIPSDLLKQEQL